MEKQGNVISIVSWFLITYLLMSAIYGWYLKSNQTVADYPSVLMAQSSAFVLSIFNYKIVTQASLLAPKIFLNYNNLNVLAVSEACNGVSVLIIFTSLILCIPSLWKLKIYFWLYGFISIFILNIIRIVALFLIVLSHPQLFKIFHEYVFTGIIYLVCFFIFTIYVRKSFPTNSEAK